MSTPARYKLVKAVRLTSCGLFDTDIPACLQYFVRGDYMDEYQIATLKMEMALKSIDVEYSMSKYEQYSNYILNAPVEILSEIKPYLQAREGYNARLYDNLISEIAFHTKEEGNFYNVPSGEVDRILKMFEEVINGIKNVE